MSRRHLHILVILSAVFSGGAYWDLSKPVDEMAPRRILRVAISESGRWIAAGSASGWIGIFDTTHPDSPQRFRGGPGHLHDLRFSQDEQWLIIANDTMHRHAVQSLGSLEPLAPGDDPGEPPSQPEIPNSGERTSNVVAGPNGTAVMGNYAGSIEIRDQRSGEILRRFTFR